MRGRSLPLAVYALLSMALLLSGCAGSETASPPPGGADMAGVIFVVPLEGAPTRTGLILADAIAAEIRDGNHPAILSYEPNQAGASVVGKVVTADLRGNVIWLGVDWAIRAPYGTHVASYRQHVVIDALMWRNAAPEAINLIIADAAPRIAGMINDEVGPPVLAAMHHRDVTPDEPKDQMQAAPVSGAMTTMDVRRQESGHQMNQEILAAAQPAENAAPVAPAPMPSGGVQPLARIAEATNGRVVHADGSPAQLSPPAPAAPAPASVSVPDSGTIEQAAEQISSPPSGLPSLLTPVPEQAAAPSGPPQPLTPGTTIVQPPPGGISGSSSDEKEGSFLDMLNPNLDTSKRLPDDARPAGAGGAAFAKVRWGQPSFLIKPVHGAPSNGNEALTAALKSALRDRDLTISEDPRQAGFVIDGEVDTGQPVNGRQYVRIIWRVNTVTGEEVGKAVQENTVVAGSLDGEWGHVAEAVSHAAVRGIKDLFSDADEYLTSREPLPEFPDVQLPATPGRAPPPPASY
jgi:hypothetical protein